MTEEHLTAIGGVVIEWTRLENQCQILLWNLAGLNAHTGRCITQHISFRTLWDAVFSLMKEHETEGDVIDHLRSIYKRIDAYRVERNNLVHAIWGITPQSGNTQLGEATATIIKARGSLNSNQKHIRYQDIVSLGENISDAALELAEFSQTIKGKYSAAIP